MVRFKVHKRLWSVFVFTAVVVKLKAENASPCFFALLSLYVVFDVASASALRLQGGSISNMFMLALKNWVYIIYMFKQLSSGAFLRCLVVKLSLCWM